MQKQGTNYVHQTDEVVTIVGDEKQEDFYPRVKLKYRNNMGNFSIGVGEGGTHKVKKDVVEWTDGEKKARFYPITKQEKPIPTEITYTELGHITVEEACAKYELERHFGHEAFNISVYTFTGIMVFDDMPADRYLDMDKNRQAKDFDYKDKSLYNTHNKPFPSYDRLPVARCYSPYTVSANPYYSDEGLISVDIHYGNNDVPEITEHWVEATRQILHELGIKTYRQGVRSKLYFMDDGKLIKFASSEDARGVLATYFNFDCMYNKAYDFYRPDVKQDVRDDDAYGINQIGIDLPDKWEIIRRVAERFAQILKLPLRATQYPPERVKRWKRIQELQDTYEWVQNAVREDSGWHYRPPEEMFEFDQIFDTKPESNKVDFTIQTRDLVFYKQERLTADEIAEGCNRLPHVVGSYAVYHKNHSSPIGWWKAFHIYRPEAIDAEGWSVWCDMNIDEESGVLSVTIPQSFLDNAVYPIVLDPTFGYSTAGASSLTILNVIKGTVQTSPSDASTLDSISIYLNTSGSTSTTYEGAVYNGTTLVAQSANGTTVAAASWRTLNFASESISGSTDYILAAWGTAAGSYGGVINLFYDNTTGKTSKTQSITYSANNWPNPATFSDETDRQYSIYVNYTASGAATVSNLPLLGVG